MFTPPNCSNDGHMCGALKFAHTYSDAKNIPFGRYDRHLRQSNTPNLDFPPPLLSCRCQAFSIEFLPWASGNICLAAYSKYFKWRFIHPKDFPTGFYFSSYVYLLCCLSKGVQGVKFWIFTFLSLFFNNSIIMSIINNSIILYLQLYQ